VAFELTSTPVSGAKIIRAAGRPPTEAEREKLEAASPSERNFPAAGVKAAPP